MVGKSLAQRVVEMVDPSRLGWPPQLPYELVMRVASPRKLCETYGITREQWDVLRVDPLFEDALINAQEKLKDEGMAFRVKARLQSEELLATSWSLIHDKETPHNVRADLIKFTVRAAGLDGSKDQAAQAANTLNNALQININLGDK